MYDMMLLSCKTKSIIIASYNRLIIIVDNQKAWSFLYSDKLYSGRTDIIYTINTYVCVYILNILLRRGGGALRIAAVSRAMSSLQMSARGRGQRYHGLHVYSLKTYQYTFIFVCTLLCTYIYIHV